MKKEVINTIMVFIIIALWWLSIRQFYDNKATDENMELCLSAWNEDEKIIEALKIYNNISIDYVFCIWDAIETKWKTDCSKQYKGYKEATDIVYEEWYIYTYFIN